MHILYIQQILNFPETSGNCRTYEMARFYVEAGHQVTILTSSTTILPQDTHRLSTSSYTFQREGINIQVVRGSYSHFMGFLQRIRAFLIFFFRAYLRGRKIQHVDRIIAYSPPLTGAELGRRLARYHQAPLVLEIADVWPDVPIGMGILKNPHVNSLLKGWTKRLYQKAQLLLPYSEGMKDQLLTYSVDSTKIKVVHNGVNLKDWPTPEGPTSSTGVIQIIYAGTIGQANGIEQLVEAVDLLQQWDLPSFHLLIIGQGNRAAEVKAYAHSRALKGLSFHPWVERSKLRKWMREADIGVSSFAPYPVLEANGATKFFDYLANALPIVLNYQGWQAHYLDRYSCGLSSPQGDLEGFCRNLQRLIENPDLRRSMGANGKKLAANHFDRRILAQNSLDLIRAIP